MIKFLKRIFRIKTESDSIKIEKNKTLEPSVSERKL